MVLSVNKFRSDTKRLEVQLQILVLIFNNHGELETILGSKKGEKKLNIGRYRIKYSL